MKKVALVLTGIGMGFASGAMALDAGDVLLRVGMATAIPHEHTRLDGVAVGDDIGLDRQTAGGFSMSYMLTHNWAAGFAVTTPFKHQMTAHGVVLPLTVGEYEMIMPTFTGQYHYEFGNFKPYAGAGITYAMFLDLDEEEQTLGGGSSIDGDDELTWSAEIGFDYQLNPDTYVNVGITYIDLDTDVQLENVLGVPGSDVNVSMTIDPVVYTFGFVHKF